MKAFTVMRRSDVVIERRGRPRKPKKINSDKVVNVNAVAQLMPHRREVPPALRHDQRAECVLGRLMLTKHISDEQYRAGVLLRDCVRRYHAVFNVPRHNRGAMPLDGLRSGGGAPMQDEAAMRFKEAHRRVYDALIDAVGVRGAQCVTHVAVYDQPQTMQDITLLRKALTVLVMHYRLTDFAHKQTQR